ncbi:MAG: ribosome maturation factor RimM [Candidatus Acidiferrales bacterium]
MANSDQQNGVTIAVVVRPHGVRGEVACDILTDFPDRLKTLKTADLWDGKRPPRHVAVRKCWLSYSHGGQAIFHFEGVDSIDAAKKLVGLEVQVCRDQRVKLPSGSHYISDLVGCKVIQGDGTEVGVVKDVQAIGETVVGTPILEVTVPAGDELLIPLAQDICVSIDTDARVIEVILPEGLRDINRP